MSSRRVNPGGFGATAGERKSERPKSEVRKKAESRKPKPETTCRLRPWSSPCFDVLFDCGSAQARDWMRRSEWVMEFMRLEMLVA